MQRNNAKRDECIMPLTENDCAWCNPNTIANSICSSCEKKLEKAQEERQEKKKEKKK